MQAKRMDVVAGETAGVEGQLLLLYPVLFILQVCGVNSKLPTSYSSWTLQSSEYVVCPFVHKSCLIGVLGILCMLH